MEGHQILPSSRVAAPGVSPACKSHQHTEPTTSRGQASQPVLLHAREGSSLQLPPRRRAGPSGVTHPGRPRQRAQGNLLAGDWYFQANLHRCASPLRVAPSLLVGGFNGKE